MRTAPELSVVGMLGIELLALMLFRRFAASVEERVGGRVVVRKVTALKLLSVVGVLEFGLSPLVAAEWYIVMTFTSVVSKRAASGVVVEQVDVVRVILFEDSERGAELIAMVLTSPEDGVAVTSPVANSQFADRSGIGVVGEVLVVNGPLVDEVLVVVAVVVAERGGKRVVWTDVTASRLLSVDAALTGVVRREIVVERDVTTPVLSSVFDMLVQAVTPAAGRERERVVETDVTATGLLSVIVNTALVSSSLAEVVLGERVVKTGVTATGLLSVVDALDFRLSQLTDVVVGKTLSPPV